MHVGYYSCSYRYGCGYNPCSRIPLSSLLEGYQCVRHDEHVSFGTMGDSVPPFGLAFSSAGDMHHVLAAANEEGIVRIYDTKSPDLVGCFTEWLAHENAVFDIAWVPGESQLVTAAGDQMARLWDVKSGEPLGSFKGHLCSLKSVAFAPGEKAVFCTGGRDGNIMVWDIRCSQKDGFYRQVKQISGAHNKSETSAPSKTKKRRSSTRGMAPSVDTQQSVTVVLFRDQHTLVSSGAVDGVVKMWDLRKNYTAYRHDPVPMQTYPYAGSSTRMRLGYSGLVLDSSRANIMCNCTDDSIYMFNVCGIKTSPVAVFSGHQNSSFYVKSSISPDDQFLASGSSDHHTYIWKFPPFFLRYTIFGNCTDICNLVPTVRAATPPAKTQMMQRFAGLTSPQPAACASNSAALPLPSSTTSPDRPTPVPVHQKTPTSIKQWLSPTHGSRSRVTATTPPHQEPGPRPPSPASGSSPTERRAKRKLETGESSPPPGCEDGARCECVSELSPEAKRSRVLFGVCNPPQERSAQTDCHAEGGEPVTPWQAGKENCSLRTGNWLSEIGQKMKKSHGGTSGHKKQDGKTHTSSVSAEIPGLDLNSHSYSVHSTKSKKQNSWTCFP
uniref:Denticleless E3 ubiquitin protein ligase homolog (Drosophila) n=1 Tax=Fundulus heteroclitus TaxID=8078 RepID=A0A3Q2Q3D7_FUNHE